MTIRPTDSTTRTTTPTKAATPNAPASTPPASQTPPRPNSAYEQGRASGQAIADGGWVAGPSRAPKTTAPASSVDPLELIKHVKNGDVEFELPLEPGKLGPVKVKDGTVMKFKATVRDGKLVMDSVKADFQPDLDGPLWADVRGAKVKDGRLTLDIRGCPDPSIGPKLPKDLAGLINTVQGAVQSRSADVSVFGIKLATVSDHGAKLSAPGYVVGAIGVAGAVIGKGAHALGLGGKGGAQPQPGVNFNGVKVHLDNVEMYPGPLSLGPAGSVDLAPGARLNIDGNLNDVKVRGHVGVRSLDLDTNGVKLKGGEGSVDVAVDLHRENDGRTTVKANLDHLNVKTQYAVSRRENGDYVSLGQGEIRDGSIRMEETMRLDGTHVEDVHHHLSSLTIDNFRGTVTGAQLTVPDQHGTATVTLGRSTVEGRLHVEPGSIGLEGTVDGKVGLADFQGGRGIAAIDVRLAQLSGRGNVKFDSRTGLKVSRGQMQLHAELNKASLEGNVPVVGSASGSVGAGTAVDLKVNGVDFDTRNGLTAIDSLGVHLDARDIRALAGDHEASVDDISGGVTLNQNPGAAESWEAERRQLEEMLRGTPGEYQNMVFGLRLLIGLFAQMGPSVDDLRRMANNFG